jgi:hypothetical protein
VLGIFTLIVLMRPSVKEMFATARLGSLVDEDFREGFRE